MNYSEQWKITEFVTKFGDEKRTKLDNKRKNKTKNKSNKKITEYEVTKNKQTKKNSRMFENEESHINWGKYFDMRNNIKWKKLTHLECHHKPIIWLE